MKNNIQRVISGFAILPIFVNYKSTIFGKFYLLQEYNEEYNCWIDIKPLSKDEVKYLELNKPFCYDSTTKTYNYLIPTEVLKKLPTTSEHFTDMLIVFAIIFVVLALLIFIFIFGI